MPEARKLEEVFLLYVLGYKNVNVELGPILNGGKARKRFSSVLQCRFSVEFKMKAL